jgi:transcription elongation factor GreA
MAVEVVNSLTELLNEEKWTRATLKNYTVKNFTDLDDIIQDAKKKGTLGDVRGLVTEHLNHTPNSIIALYVMGKLNFVEQSLDEGHIQKLINLFYDNKRFNIVEFLAKETLKYGENKYALVALSQCLSHDNREDELAGVWERLVKIDYEEAELTRKLAAVREKQGAQEEAVEYYKKALLRFLKRGTYNPVEELWLKLTEFIPDDLNFFLSTEKRIADTISSEKSAFLLSFLVPHYTEKEEHDIAIELLKKILSYNPRDKGSREDIVDAFTMKYHNHSHLEEYLEKSGLREPSVDVQEAINTFENHIMFDVDSYVFHRTWGIGRVRDIKEDNLIIDFKDRPRHRMTLEMALNCLQLLPEDHIWLQKGRDLNRLRELMLNDVEEGLRILIKSKNNAATVKDFKDELLRGVLTKKEWSRWWNRAKTILKKNPYFGTDPENNDVYYIRKKPISYNEDIFNRFKNEKSYDRRFELFDEFVRNGDIESEYFEDMLDYFKGFVSSPNNLNENSLKSFLLLRNVKNTYAYLPIEFSFDFETLLETLKDIHSYLPVIPDNELKKSFLMHLKRNAPNWDELFVKSFFLHPMKFIIDVLIEEGRGGQVNEMLTNITSHYREFTDLFIWVTRNLIVRHSGEEISIDQDQAIMGLTHLLEISSRELANERNIVQNRKVFNTIVDILFRDDLLVDYIRNASEAKVRRLIPTILNIDELKDEHIIKTRFAIKTTFPSIVFDDEVESVDSTKQLLVTQRSYELKQSELKYLMEVEIPQNSREIGEAMEKGDLRENAEYKFALEKQEFLKRQIKLLSESLNRAKILKMEDIKTNVISVGTMITLNSLEDDKTEKFTILGPWESEPSKKVISYTSPMGENLLNRSVGDTVDLSANNKKRTYKILKIERAIF